jgi:hypothetical protein
MKNALFLPLALLLLFAGQTSRPAIPEPPAPAKMQGLSFVAPRDSFHMEAMDAVRASGATWIAAIPYAFTREGEPRVHYNNGRQWWGERPEGCRHTIELAKAAGLKVMLKPQVWVPRSWTGNLDFDTEESWQSWESDYEAYILPLAEMAEVLGVELFCIGTEFKAGAPKREHFWRQLIAKVRERYKGPLVYAANWDEYPDTPFWDALDYIGVNAYFPLSEEGTPDPEQLRRQWQPTVEALRDFSNKTGRPIIFTEFGYLSVDGCAGKTWELEKRLPELQANEQAQAQALDALFSTFWPEEFWAGGFLWKWYPNKGAGEHYWAKDYTPQGKTAMETLAKWYR